MEAEMVSLIAGGVAGLAAAGMAWAVRGRSSTVFGPSVHRGPRDRRAVALTFDDGPSESTPDLLETLAEYDVPATFFMCGDNVRRLPNIVREVAAAGHEIGNHSDSHGRLWLRSPKFIYNELFRAQEAIKATSGVFPTLVRVPFGVRWFGLRKAQRRLDLTGVMWTVIGLDWKLDADAVARRVLRKTVNGAILCLHDGRGPETKPDIRVTVEAVRLIVPELLGRGYRFERVSDLLCPTTWQDE